MVRKYLSLLVLAIVILSSCEKETRTLNVIEDEKIQSYLESNNLTGFTKDSTGFYYKVIIEGTGDAIEYKDFINISHTTTSINKSVNFSVSKYQPLGSFAGYLSPISWRESVIKLSKGGEVWVITPSYLAFGKTGSGASIPGNAILETKIRVANDKDRIAYEDGLIQEFLAENNITAIKDTSGIYYQILTAGTGTSVTTTSATVKVAYQGRLLTGTVFDQASTGSPASLVLNNTIQGWIKGVPLIVKGGKIRLFIPSRFAYGERGRDRIPPNAILDFDIELIDVTN